MPKAPGVLLEGLDGVEAHRLVVHQRREELHGVVALQPGRLVRGDGEGVGVGLREHVVAVDLGEYLPGGLFGDAVPGRSLPEPLPVHGDQVLVVGTCERPADLVGLGGGHPGHVHEQLDHLLLPDDDAIPPLQRPLLQGMVVLEGDAVPVALHESAHRAALNADAGPDEGDLVGEVEEVAGAEALPHLELGRGLE